MATAQLGTLLRHLHQLAAGRAPEWTDRQLLDDFAARHDENAFAALVARHGPMVLRVCRRVLGHEQDAEDAFQATFLVLARHTESIHRREALASWLHGVAYRTALKAKRSAARRRNHEARLRDRRTGCPSVPPNWDEVQAALDEEVERLPDPFRAAFVLCVLEGKGRTEAAAELGVKEGTVWSRVARARQLLQRRLTRRGIQLAAALAALSVAETAATAGVPAVLVQVTIRSGLLVAAGEPAAGVIPSHAAELAAGVTRAMFPTRATVTTALLLAAGLLLAGAGTLARQALAAGEPPPAGPKSDAGPPQPGSAAAKPSAATEQADAVEVRGRVAGPDGKPLAGATLSLGTGAAQGGARRARATTGADGRFRITVRTADLRGQATLVAAAEGYGPDWAVLPHSIPKDHEVALRLARDDVPISGRLLNLEGRGIAGVTVQVRRVEKRADDGDLAAFIATKRQWARGNYINGPDLKSLGAAAWPAATSVTTDAEGRFRLTGFGRERVVHLTIRARTIEPIYVEALTRTGPVEGLYSGNENDTVYGATFERVIPPGKAIAGTVREKRTGKPLAGVTVSCGRCAATTGAGGRYRIDGPRKRSEYSVTASGVLPYFDATRSNVPDTPGFEPVSVDFELERGLAIRGRVLDKATGKPVQASIDYHAFADNPYLKTVSGVGPGVYVRDGSFALTGLPGPGVLAVMADEDDYLKVAPAADWELVPGINWAPRVGHAFVRIDPSEKDPKSAVFEIRLEPAAAVKAHVVGPDGEPFTGYYSAGLTATARVHSSAMIPQRSAAFTVRGLDPHGSRVVVVFSPEKKLGKVRVVWGDEAGPLPFRLEPLSSLTGRVLGANGRPRAGLTVRAVLSREGEDGARLPIPLRFDLGRDWANLEPQAVTDAEGKFRLDGLLPGLKYVLAVSEDGSTEGEGVILRREGVSPPAAGRNEDLGNLRSKKGRGSP
jgi:RNA polymerase sigma factor (sigma-70 family)